MTIFYFYSYFLLASYLLFISFIVEQSQNYHKVESNLKNISILNYLRKAVDTMLHHPWFLQCGFPKTSIFSYITSIQP